MVTRDFTALQNLIADPRFVNRTAKDFRVAADSPCAAVLAGSGTPPPPAPQPQPAPAPQPQPAPRPAPAGVDRPPVVEITGPRDGASFRRILRMSAAAKDDKRVARVDFYVDSRLVDRDKTAPYRETWRVRRLGYGSHTVTAKAYDSAGQVDADAVSVRRIRGVVAAKSKGRGAKRKTRSRR
jgi:hypothetical protein